MTAPAPLHTGRLVLVPRDAEAVVDVQRLLQRLGAAGFIAEPLPEPPGAHAAGAHFLQMLAFTGCAVHLNTKPGAQGPAGTHIRVLGPYPQPQLMYGRNSRPPGCPACGKALADWREQVGGSRLLRCDACNHSAPAWQWKWRRQAGCGRILICVEDVFPGEATPLPPLLDALRAASGGEWQYFYIQDDARDG
ncbi:hypothetical protein F2Q65_17490 [Thiohalocapsa marina]|uniref:Uncharacterized protein n=1 Tax=Thiohalocapsa marina TaxID=424902 RepID=A0A5M8FCT3_9GAMM|nr:hypothetical protein [Thiohalocapsa marina]KAA6182693.1 hypothetical protein F2Q65_17490 [Thiohalocapsa marina]